jgi:hypothetical protein
MALRFLQLQLQQRVVDHHSVLRQQQRAHQLTAQLREAPQPHQRRLQQGALLARVPQALRRLVLQACGREGVRDGVKCHRRVRVALRVSISIAARGCGAALCRSCALLLGAPRLRLAACAAPVSIRGLAGREQLCLRLL